MCGMLWNDKGGRIRDDKHTRLPISLVGTAVARATSRVATARRRIMSGK